MDSIDFKYASEILASQHHNQREQLATGAASRLAAGHSNGFNGHDYHESIDDNHNHHPETTSATSNNNDLINWNLIMKYVNFNLVRNLIAQHLAELIILCVIIIYLAYYFSRISKVSSEEDS